MLEVLKRVVGLSKPPAKKIKFRTIWHQLVYDFDQGNVKSLKQDQMYARTLWLRGFYGEEKDFLLEVLGSYLSDPFFQDVRAKKWEDCTESEKEKKARVLSIIVNWDGEGYKEKIKKVEMNKEEIMQMMNDVSFPLIDKFAEICCRKVRECNERHEALLQTAQD